MESAEKPFRDAVFARTMSVDEFKTMSEYCFENLILKDIGRKNIDSNFDMKQLLIFRKMVFTFIDMVIVNNFSAQNAFENTQTIFGLDQDKCEIWWNMVEKNEEKLWRIMMMRQNKAIENKIDMILEK